MITDNIGLYIHIPFCRSKCPYCDFYSFIADDASKKAYTDAVIECIKSDYTKYKRKADTLYIGGGTPSSLETDDLVKIINTAKETFLTDDAEITIECNPYDASFELFSKLYDASVNRISMGMQSANDIERKKLGRRSSREDITKAVTNAKKAGISNISLDLMLGIPSQSEESLLSSLDFCISLDIPHISAYILKIEEATPFYKLQSKLNLPSDDEVADMYLVTCDYLSSHGIKQYEISNFAKEGFESKHNLKYWNCLEYLGIGPAAHSFIDGKRFFYDRDFTSFVNAGLSPVYDGQGGSFSEYVMLGLRLCQGISDEQTVKRFGHKMPDKLIKAAEKYIDNGFMEHENGNLKLTAKGFLLSNTILADIL